MNLDSLYELSLLWFNLSTSAFILLAIGASAYSVYQLTQD